MAEEVEDTGKREIDNGEAWERYVKQFRSNSEAAEQFIADEKLVGNEDQRRGLKKKWVNRMGLLRSKWAKLSRARKSEQTKESFQNFKLEIFFDRDQSDLPVNEQSNVEEEKADSEELETSEPGNKRVRLVSPLNELSPRQTQRRTDNLFSALREKAMKQYITTTQLLGYLLHR